MNDEVKRMFFEDNPSTKCPKCGNGMSFLEVGDGDKCLIDFLGCEFCGFKWKRIYKYAWSCEMK